MAVFIPAVKPEDFNNSYGDKKVYEALRSLNDRYTIFYSLSWIGINENRTIGEADFVILHPDKGVLVIEVKSGEIEYKDGEWIQTKQGMNIPEIDAETISTMMRQQYRSYAEFIRKDYTKERAEQYQKEVDTFFTAGWRALLRF